MPIMSSLPPLFAAVRRHKGMGAAVVLVAASLTAVLAQTAAPAAAGSAAASAEMHGLDPADMDTTAKACQDFYKYSNGGWMKKNPIPPEYPSWGTFSELAERNREAMHRILEKLAKEKSAAGSDEQKLGDFYTSCMDETAVEAQGAKPLAPELARIDKIQNISDLRSEVARLQTHGVGVLFGFGSQQDRKNSSEVIAGAFQGGLGLPDRDYYTKTDDKSKELRGQFVEHVKKMLTLLGDDAARAGVQAKTVLDELAAQLFRFVVGLRVVVAVGQSQASLEGARDHLARVLAVLLGAEAEEDADSVSLKPRNLGAEVRNVLYLVDPRELRGERLCPLRLDGGLVHAARVEVAKLLLVGARGGLLFRELLQYPMHRLAISLRELGKRPPARVFGRNRVLLHPAAVGVLVEVLARFRRRVHVGGVEPVHFSARRGGSGGGRGGGLREDRGQRRRNEHDRGAHAFVASDSREQGGERAHDRHPPEVPPGRRPGEKESYPSLSRAPVREDHERSSRVRAIGGSRLARISRPPVREANACGREILARREPPI